MAMEILSGHNMIVNPMSYRVWLQLPEEWSSANFTMEAHRRGVAVAPAEAFAVKAERTANAVRICLGAAEDRKELRTGLETLAELLHRSPRYDSGTF